MLQRLTMVMSAVGLVMTAACSQSDTGITTAVKSRLAADETVKAYQIDVSTSNGVVTLSGAVDSPAAKEQAVVVARATEGVSDVVDRIEIGESVVPTTGGLEDGARGAAGRGVDAAKDAAGQTAELAGDAAITAAVKTKFFVDTVAPGMKIDVDTKDGVVTLNGTVANQAEADRAVLLARQTDGVKRVASKLTINPQPAGENDGQP